LHGVLGVRYASHPAHENFLTILVRLCRSEEVFSRVCEGIVRHVVRTAQIYRTQGGEAPYSPPAPFRSCMYLYP